MTNNSKFLVNLARVLGHTIWYEEKMHDVGLVCCGPDSANVSDAIKMNKESIDELVAKMPEYYAAVTEAAPGLAAAQYESQLKYSPKFAKQQADTYKTYAPELSSIASDISAQNARDYLSSTLGNLTGTGRQISLEADKTQRMLDPEYYKLREATSNAILDQIANPVTGGEYEALQRGINAQGVGKGYMPNNARTIAAAQTYGDKRASKLNAALDKATAAMPQVKSGLDAFKQTTGQEGRSNATSSYFPNTVSNDSVSQSGSIANSLMGAGTAGMGTMANYFGNYLNLQTANDPLNRFGMSMSGALGGMLGSRS